MEFEVRFIPSGKTQKAAVGTTLLEVARKAGLPVASACGANGLCGLCGMQILRGAENLPEETPREVDIKRRNRTPEELRLSCRLEPTGDLEVTAPYW